MGAKLREERGSALCVSLVEKNPINSTHREIRKG